MSWPAVEALLDLLLPPRCGACGAHGRAPYCRLCTEAVEVGPRLSLPGFEDVFALHVYGGPVAVAIRALKYEDRPELGPPLGRALAAALRGRPPPDLVVPIPTSRRRLAQRGYNPAREIARGMPFPVRPRALRRLGDPRPQVGLPRQERLENPRGGFQAHGAAVRGRSVLLVDDVMTTGATLSAARAALDLVGVGSVAAAVVAHAVADDGA